MKQRSDGDLQLKILAVLRLWRVFWRRRSGFLLRQILGRCHILKLVKAILAPRPRWMNIREKLTLLPSRLYTLAFMSWGGQPGKKVICAVTVALLPSNPCTFLPFESLITCLTISIGAPPATTAFRSSAGTVWRPVCTANHFDCPCSFEAT